MSPPNLPLKYVFRLEENASRVVGQIFTNSLGKQQHELSARTGSGRAPWNRGKFVSHWSKTNDFFPVSGKKLTVFLGASAYCLAQCDDRGDRTNQFLWLKLLHTSYISLLNQEEKDRVFYSVDKRFKSAADKRNFCNKQILKICTPLHVCRHFTARSRARLWRRV